ncbi:hypothetical protein [Kitasatospora aureofaciens]|uniref:hypothetical protein n=1 Tax=Kitasatospora aureofaciens TaxID=1894 RepID=UPI0037FCEE12
MTADQAFETEMLRQIVKAMRGGDPYGATRLTERLLAESTDPVATEARIQQAIQDAS